VGSLAKRKSTVTFSIRVPCSLPGQPGLNVISLCLTAPVAGMYSVKIRLGRCRKYGLRDLPSQDEQDHVQLGEWDTSHVRPGTSETFPRSSSGLSSDRPVLLAALLFQFPSERFPSQPDVLLSRSRRPPAGTGDDGHLVHILTGVR